jgi:hypothetical protein
MPPERRVLPSAGPEGARTAADIEYLRVFFAAKRGQHARIGTCFREAPPPVVIVRIPLQVEFCSSPDQPRNHFVIVSALDLMLRRVPPRVERPP